MDGFLLLRRGTREDVSSGLSVSETSAGGGWLSLSWGALASTGDRLGGSTEESGISGR